MKTIFPKLAILFLFTLQMQAQSELFVDFTLPEQMVWDLFDGTCVDISNVTFKGSGLGVGYFEAVNTDLGISRGILMSTGRAASAVGPVGPNGSSHLGGSGDDDLSIIANAPTLDAEVLEFNLTSEVTDTLSFYYVFASEEYPENLDQYNDVFAILVKEAGCDQFTNIALLPDGQTPVSINTVNNSENSEYYVDYQGINGIHLKYDGMTVVLTASFVVQANESYHIKIAIADVNDAVYDSAIFLGLESLCGNTIIQPHAEAGINIYGDTSLIMGDTVSIHNKSRYATSYFWDFGDNTTSTMHDPFPHVYEEDGFYTISLNVQNYCCSDSFNTTIQIGDTFEIDASSCDIGYYDLMAIPPGAGQEGLWSVIAGNGNLNDPSDPNSLLNEPSVGLNVLKWEITEIGTGNTVLIDTFLLKVNPFPQVRINTDLNSLCENDTLVQLVGVPSGGVFEGEGVSGNIFNPKLAGTGNHTISYNYTNANGCTNTDIVIAEVLAAPTTPEIILIGNDSLSCNVVGDAYLWEFNGNPINSTEQQILIEGNGNYTVTVIHSCCSSDTSEDFMFTSIANILNNINGHLHIFPNPANESIQIKLSDLELNGAFESIKVYNAPGELILQLPFQSGIDVMDIDISGLATGIYFIQLRDKEGYYSGSFIKK